MDGYSEKNKWSSHECYYNVALNIVHRTVRLCYILNQSKAGNKQLLQKIVQLFLLLLWILFSTTFEKCFLFFLLYFFFLWVLHLEVSLFLQIQTNESRFFFFRESLPDVYRLGLCLCGTIVLDIYFLNII